MEKKEEEKDANITKTPIKKQEPSSIYLGARVVEVISIGIFVFGLLWEGTLVLNLNTPEFMMFYGGVGAIISEVLARIFKKKQNIK